MHTRKKTHLVTKVENVSPRMSKSAQFDTNVCQQERWLLLILLLLFLFCFVLFFKCGDNIKDPKCRVFDDYTTVVVIARETTRTKIRCLVFIAYLVMPLNLHSPTSPFSGRDWRSTRRGVYSGSLFCCPASRLSNSSWREPTDKGQLAACSWRHTYTLNTEEGPES